MREGGIGGGPSATGEPNDEEDYGEEQHSDEMDEDEVQV